MVFAYMYNMYTGTYVLELPSCAKQGAESVYAIQNIYTYHVRKQNLKLSYTFSHSSTNLHGYKT